MNRFTRHVAVTMILALFGSAPGHAAKPLQPGGTLVAKSLPDLVAEAEWIVVADLVDIRPRRNARGNLIVSDYSFHTVTALLGLVPPAEFTLTQAGGTLDGVTQHLSDTPELRIGSRYLLFVRPDRGEAFPPFVGAGQGVFVLHADGTSRALAGGGAPRATRALLDSVDALVAARDGAPPRAPQPAAVAPGTYPAKTYVPLAAPPVGDAARPPQPRRASSGPAAGNAGRDQASGAALPFDAALPGHERPAWVYSHLIAPPAVFSAFPHDWAYHPAEENQLAFWNRFGGNIFQVYTTPMPTWAYGNGIFDLAGFPSDQEMIDQFGEPWAPDTIGITYTITNASGTIIEADIAFNPAYCWTLDEVRATDGTAECSSFRATMLHEAGHAWGLDHPWETQQVSWDSIMNYAPAAYRFAQLHADDVAALRTAFGGPAMHDALLSLYTTGPSSGVGGQPVYGPTQPYWTTLRHGANLVTALSSQFKIENLGTDDLVLPEVDFYLSEHRLDWLGTYVFVGGGTYATVPAGWIYTYWAPAALIVPDTTPTGDYFLAAYLTNADQDLANNSAWAPQHWSNSPITVHIDNNAPTLAPLTAWQASEGFLGPSGEWTFEFLAGVGTTYTFGMCADSDGSADFDTTLSLRGYYSDTELAYNDDACGLQSEIVWTAPYDGRFKLVVGSYQSAGQGTFWLGYARGAFDRIFRAGFE